VGMQRGRLPARPRRDWRCKRPVGCRFALLCVNVLRAAALHAKARRVVWGWGWGVSRGRRALPRAMCHVQGLEAAAGICARPGIRNQKPALACALAHRAGFSLLKMLGAHSGPQASPAHPGRAVGGEDSVTIAPAGRPIATGTPAQAPGQTTHTMRVVQVRWVLKRRAQGRTSGCSQRQQRLSFVRSRPHPLADA
jgi:hypothetical protein